MISVVVCSINQGLAAQLEKNIYDTIGVPFEMIVLDNNLHKQSINYIYNLGAGMAKFDLICFLHEDIIINTKNWGNILTGNFNRNPQLGLIGIAGAKYKAKAYSGWYTGISEFDCCLVTHLDKEGKERRMYLNPGKNTALQNVVVVDGVFMCSPKKVWEDIRFDDVLLKGFHFYDVDYSFRVSRKYETAVSFEIDIIHLTEGGDFGNNWIQHCVTWHDKYASQLPVSCEIIQPSKKPFYELTISKTWLNYLMKEKVSFKKRLKWLAKLGLVNVTKLTATVVKFMAYDFLKYFLTSKQTGKSS